jgi:hypothetical protein
VPVSTLLDALWPAVDETRARASLRTAASHLRKVLGPDSVARLGGGLQLMGAWVDAGAFTDLAAEVSRNRRHGRLAECVRATREAEALVGERDRRVRVRDRVREHRAQRVVGREARLQAHVVAVPAPRRETVLGDRPDLDQRALPWAAGVYQRRFSPTAAVPASTSTVPALTAARVSLMFISTRHRHTGVM